jgi:hypothetical protein
MSYSKDFKFILEERLINFSVEVMKIVKELPADRIENIWVVSS